MKAAVYFIIAFISVEVLAVKADSQQWLSLSGQGLISQKASWGIYFEAQARRSENKNDIYESLIRPAIFYKSQDYGSFFLGTFKKFDHNEQENENRHWLQWVWQPQWRESDFRNTIRLRLEQRDLKDQSELSNRFRFMFRTLHTSILGNHIRPFASVELFYHLNTVDQNIQSGHSQTRSSLGLSFPLREKDSLDVSYLHAHVFNRQDTAQANHVLNIGYSFNF